MYFTLEEIKQYDPSLSLGQLIKILEDKEISELKQNENEYNEVKENFENVYLKFFDKKGIFGPELSVYHITKIVKQDIKKREKNVYHVEGEKVVTHKFEIHLFKMKENYGSFSYDELKAMTPITKDEYDSFVNEHNSVKNKLVHLLNKK